MKLTPYQRIRGMPDAIDAEVTRDGDCHVFRYVLTGFLPSFAVAPRTEPKRRDGLWETTCFEAFVAGYRDSYIELNFSPSGQWAAYAFAGYREGKHDLDLAAPPQVAIESWDEALTLTAAVRLPDGFASPGAALSLSAVVEEKGDGEKSHWALDHPAAGPDFHHRDCFIARLP